MEYGKCTDCDYALIRQTKQQTTIYCIVAMSPVNIRDPYLECSDYMSNKQAEKVGARITKKISGASKSKASMKTKK